MKQINILTDTVTARLFIEGLSKLPYERVARPIEGLAQLIHAAENPPPEPKRRKVKPSAPEPQE